MASIHTCVREQAELLAEFASPGWSQSGGTGTRIVLWGVRKDLEFAVARLPEIARDHPRSPEI